jgi:predicted nucleotidyltransferase
MVIIMDFKNFLKKHKFSRKIFGRRELEIIFKQLEGQNLKQSERNRLSRDIRPKFEFIRDICAFRGDFRIEKGQTNKMLIKRTLDIILDDMVKDDISAVLLFGSYADNSYTAKSDIDICVVFKRDVTLKDATLFRMRIMGRLPEKVDVQVFNILPLKIKREIARNHRVLYETGQFDNIDFSVKYLKDNDFFIRQKKIFGAET